MSQAITPSSVQFDVPSHAPARDGGACRAPSYHMQVARDEAALAALRDEWHNLADRSTASIFNAPAWIDAWREQFGDGRQPFVVTARDAAGQLVGLLPLSIERRWALGRRVRRAGFLADTDVFGDYMDCVAEQGREETVTAALLGEVKRASREWDVLDLRDMSSESSTARIARTVFNDSTWVISEEEGEACPYTRLERSQPFETFLKSTRRRDNYLRRRKWLERQPGFAIDRATDPASVGEHLAIFLRLHAMRWEGQAGGIRGPRLEAFHERVVHEMATRGEVQLFTMSVEGTPVASVYGLRDHNRFLYYNAGYDPAWANRSVGMVLVGETFSSAIEQGLDEYDFLRGDESYKTDWVDRSRRLMSLRIHAARGRGAWLKRHEECARLARQMLRR